MTPRWRSGALKEAILLYAPRSLKAPMGCRFSGLRYRVRSSSWSGTIGVRTTIRWMRAWASRISVSVIVSRASPASASCVVRGSRPGETVPGFCISNFQNHRHDQRTLLGLLGNISLQISADFFFDHAIVGALLLTGMSQGIDYDLPNLVKKAIFQPRKAAGHDLR